jgi:PKD repeat protein
MTYNFLRKFGKLAFLMVFLPSLAKAQFFSSTPPSGDVDSGFRKTGSFAEQDEMVVYLGNISNYMAMAAGTTTNITFYTNALATMCPDGYGNLQWSVFSTFELTGGTGFLTNSSGAWPKETCWYTVPRTNVTVQTTPVGRFAVNAEGSLRGNIVGTSSDASSISRGLYTSAGNTNADNFSLLVLEPVNYEPQYLLTATIGDSSDSSYGDFGGELLDFSVENVTSNTFSSAVVSDFYVNVPEGNANDIDPITGTTTGNADYLGYFTLNPNGTMSFTRAAAVTAPSVSAVSASATNGFGPLTVVFSDSTSGSATNWIWNFGNGIIITNTTGGNVTNTYAASGSYTVTLTVNGPGGSGTDTIANFIVALPTPKISLKASSGNIVFSGTNCPPGVQYRILTSTNLLTTLASWKPVFTNQFASGGTFSYTNSVGSGHSYFILVSP